MCVVSSDDDVSPFAEPDEPDDVILTEPASTDQPSEHETVDQPSEHSSSDEPSEYSSADQLDDVSLTEPASTDQPSEDETTDEPSEYPSADQPDEPDDVILAGHVSADQPLDRRSADQLSDPAFADQRIDHAFTDEPFEHETADQPSASADQSSEHEADDQPSEHSSTDEPSEYSSANQPDWPDDVSLTEPASADQAFEHASAEQTDSGELMSGYAEEVLPADKSCDNTMVNDTTTEHEVKLADEETETKDDKQVSTHEMRSCVEEPSTGNDGKVDEADDSGTTAGDEVHDTTTEREVELADEDSETKDDKQVSTDEVRSSVEEPSTGDDGKIDEAGDDSGTTVDDEVHDILTEHEVELADEDSETKDDKQVSTDEVRSCVEEPSTGDDGKVDEAGDDVGTTIDTEVQDTTTKRDEDLEKDDKHVLTDEVRSCVEADQQPSTGGDGKVDEAGDDVGTTAGGEVHDTTTEHEVKLADEDSETKDDKQVSTDEVRSCVEEPSTGDDGKVDEAGDDVGTTAGDEVCDTTEREVELADEDSETKNDKQITDEVISCVEADQQPSTGDDGKVDEAGDAGGTAGDEVRDDHL